MAGSWTLRDRIAAAILDSYYEDAGRFERRLAFKLRDDPIIEGSYRQADAVLAAIAQYGEA